MVNKVTLIGRIGKDIELKKVKDTAAARVSLATTEYWYDKDKQKQEKTTWHNVVVWGRLAENVAKYASKGDLIYVDGKIDFRSYDDKDGQKKYIFEVIASSINFLSTKPKSKENGSDSELFNSSEEIPF